MFKLKNGRMNYGSNKISCVNTSIFLWTISTLMTYVSPGFFSKNQILVTSFKYELCDPNLEIRNAAWGRNVDLLTTAYGDLDVSGTIVTTVNLTSPIKASVSMKRKLLGLPVPIPCIKNFGSCDYQDLCDFGYSANEECPPIFDEHDIPCRCPIERGTYDFPGGQFKIPPTRWAGILAGNYKGTAKFYNRNILLVCYKYSFALQYI